MAFSPTSFPASSPLLAATMQENDDKLRKYLHEGIVSGDLQSGSAWVDTKHVQPPRIDPIRNVQHGVTGHLGGRVYKPGEWFTMTGAHFTRNGRSSTNPAWSEVPGTAITINLRGASKAVFHYHLTAFVCPDKTTYTGLADSLKRVYFAPYFRRAATPMKDSYVHAAGALEVRNNIGDGSTNRSGFSANRGGPAGSYNCSGYGQRTGAYYVSMDSLFTDNNEVHLGLAHWSLAQVGLVTSWAVCVEAYY